MDEAKRTPVDVIVLSSYQYRKESMYDNELLRDGIRIIDLYEELRKNGIEYQSEYYEIIPNECDYENVTTDKELAGENYSD